MTVYSLLSLLFGSGVLVAVFQMLNRRILENQKRTESIQLGVQALLRDRLKSEYEEAVKTGYASIPDKDNFENMWTQYHNLGANGVMDGIHEAYISLPTQPKGAEE